MEIDEFNTGLHHSGEGSSSLMTPDVSPDERNLPHRKRSFMQMLIDNPKESLDSVEVDEIGAVYVILLSNLSLHLLNSYISWMCDQIPFVI